MARHYCHCDGHLRFLAPKANQEVRTQMRGVILWLLGVPVIVIIFLYLFHVI
jgi:hypothetical protein